MPHTRFGPSANTRSQRMTGYEEDFGQLARGGRLGPDAGEGVTLPQRTNQRAAQINPGSTHFPSLTQEAQPVLGANTRPRAVNDRFNRRYFLPEGAEANPRLQRFNQRIEQWEQDTRRLFAALREEEQQIWEDIWVQEARNQGRLEAQAQARNARLLPTLESDSRERSGLNQTHAQAGEVQAGQVHPEPVLTDAERAAQRISRFIRSHTFPLNYPRSTPPPNDKCPICLETATEHFCVQISRVGKCGHMIGLSCLKDMLKSSPDDEKKCPLCRRRWLREVGTWQDASRLLVGGQPRGGGQPLGGGQALGGGQPIGGMRPVDGRQSVDGELPTRNHP